jgi:hypothetical protein
MRPISEVLTSSLEHTPPYALLLANAKISSFRPCVPYRRHPEFLEWIVDVWIQTMSSGGKCDSPMLMLMYPLLAQRRLMSLSHWDSRPTPASRPSPTCRRRPASSAPPRSTTPRPWPVLVCLRPAMFVWLRADRTHNELPGRAPSSPPDACLPQPMIGYLGKQSSWLRRACVFWMSLALGMYLQWAAALECCFELRSRRVLYVGVVYGGTLVSNARRATQLAALGGVSAPSGPALGSWPANNDMQPRHVLMRQ